ncbi:MAG: endonuclease III [Clostridiales bacterium]|jgi:endonuclease-3|nr:endonuclease III [Clostridiales bacterium]
MIKKDIQKVLELLGKAYPDAKPQLEYKNAFELLIAAMLSAQCTDLVVNRVTSKLFTLYKTPNDFAKLDTETLEPLIREAGLYRTKAKNIIETCKILCESFNCCVPKTLNELITLPGVGRKVANVVISNAFSVPAIAVDTHVFRVSNRIGLANAKNVLKTEEQLMANIDKGLWTIAHHWLIFHGRQVCSAKNPKCEICPINALCKYYKGENK